MRFTDYTGKYVWHCHALDRGDLDMMQLVNVLVKQKVIARKRGIKCLYGKKRGDVLFKI